MGNTVEIKCPHCHTVAATLGLDKQLVTMGMATATSKLEGEGRFSMQVWCLNCHGAPFLVEGDHVTAAVVP